MPASLGKLDCRIRQGSFLTISLWYFIIYNARFITFFFVGISYVFPMLECMLSHFSCVQLYETLCTAARQAPLFVGFSRQESWSGLPFPSPGDLPNPGMESQFPRLQVDSLTFEPLGKLCLIKAFNGLSDAIHKGRNICFTWSNDLIVHLLQGLPQNTQNSVWSNIWTPNDPVKLTHKK